MSVLLAHLRGGLLLGLGLRLVAVLDGVEELTRLDLLGMAVGDDSFFLDGFGQLLECLVQLVSLGAELVLARVVVLLEPLRVVVPPGDHAQEEDAEEQDEECLRVEPLREDSDDEADDHGDDGLLEGRTGLPDLLHVQFPSRIGQVLTRWYGAQRIHFT